MIEIYLLKVKYLCAEILWNLPIKRTIITKIDWIFSMLQFIGFFLCKECSILYIDYLSYRLEFLHSINGDHKYNSIKY